MNSKTINDVPRDRLEDAARAAKIAGYTGLAEELLALLDAPAAEADPIVGVLKRCLSEGVQPTFSGGDLKHLIRLLESKPAAQPHGEPVAIKEAYEEGFSDGSRAGDDQCNWQGFRDELAKCWPASEAYKLYAEQPAPVSVAPKLEMAHVVRAHMEIPGCPVLTSNQCYELAVKLNACIGLLAPAAERGEPHAYEYEFATALYTTGPGKFKRVITNEAPDQHEIDAGCIINVKPLYALERRKYDDTLLPFLAMMRKELHANSHKGDREGWLKMSVREAVDEVTHHFGKLANAAEARDVPQVEEYSADLANCAMMLLDACHGLPRNN